MECEIPSFHGGDRLKVGVTGMALLSDAEKPQSRSPKPSAGASREHAPHLRAPAVSVWWPQTPNISTLLVHLCVSLVPTASLETVPPLSKARCEADSGGRTRAKGVLGASLRCCYINLSLPFLDRTGGCPVLHLFSKISNSGLFTHWTG